MPTAFSAPDSSHAGQLGLEEDQGQADHQQGPGVADAPPHAQPRGGARVAAVGRDERRDRDEMVGSEAWRRPSASAIPSATSRDAPLNRPVSQASASSSG